MSKKEVQKKKLTDEEKVKETIAFFSEVERMASSQVIEIMRKAKGDLRLAEAVASRVDGIIREARWGKDYD